MGNICFCNGVICVQDVNLDVQKKRTNLIYMSNQIVNENNNNNNDINYKEKMSIFIFIQILMILLRN